MRPPPQADRPADIGLERTKLIYGGTVLPCDGVSGDQEALVTQNGKILAVGDLDEMKSVAGHDAVEINVDGATVMPGIVDTHPHCMHTYTAKATMVDLSDAKNHDDIVARIKAYIARTPIPKGEWIMCTPVGEAHYYLRRNYRDLEEGRLPDKRRLDEAAPDHPLMIQAWAPQIPNVCAFNSLGMKKLGFSWLTPPKVCDVTFHRDDGGELTGIVSGSVTNYYNHDPYWLQVSSKLPPPPDFVWEIGARAGMHVMNTIGVTTMYEGHAMTPEQIQTYKRLNNQGAMSVRVQTSLEAVNHAMDPHLQPNEEELLEVLELALSMMETDNPFYRHNGITFSRGGPCFPGFINLYEQFLDPYGRLTDGKEFLPQWVSDYMVDYCVENNLRLNAINCSDKDHDDFFKSCARHSAEVIRERNWILQHGMLSNEADVKRYKELNIGVTTCKGFHWAKGEMYGERIGKHTWKDLIPLRRWLDHGVLVGCGTDWGPHNVFEQIKFAETCEFVSGRCDHHTEAGQSVTREESLLMWTRDAAKVMGWDGIGTLEPGNEADIIILDRNPVTCDVDDLPDTKVMRTILGDRIVHDTGDLRQ